MPALLRSFLEDSRRPTGTLGYHELHGFLFAVASCPDLVPPSEWMPLVFGENAAEYESVEEAQTVIGELMALYNSINARVTEGSVALPTECTFAIDVLANLAEDAPVSQWSRGFLRGHQWLEESWEPYVPKELDEEYGSVLVALSFFASRELAEAYSAEAGESPSEMAHAVTQLLPDALVEYAHFGRSIGQVLQESDVTPRQSTPKVGRNDHCPCGSGKKYKKCCAR